MEPLPLVDSYATRNVVTGELQRLSEVAQGEGEHDPRKVAVQFEAIFWRLVLGRLREAFSEEGLFPEDPADGYGALFDLFLGDYLARSRSLGVARMVETYLRRLRESSVPTTDESTGSSQSG